VHDPRMVSPTAMLLHIVALLTLPCCSPALAAEPVPAVPKGTPYSVARRLLITMGYQPDLCPRCASGARQSAPRSAGPMRRRNAAQVAHGPPAPSCGVAESRWLRSGRPARMSSLWTGCGAGQRADSKMTGYLVLIGDTFFGVQADSVAATERRVPAG